MVKIFVHSIHRPSLQECDTNSFEIAHEMETYDINRYFLFLICEFYIFTHAFRVLSGPFAHLQAETSAVTLRTRKFMTNRLLFRKQMIVDVVHPNQPNCSNVDVRNKLAQMYNVAPETVFTFGFKTAFGGGKSTGFALIYDNLEAAMRIEPKYRLVRQKLLEVKKTGRKQRKEKKNRAKKIRGVKKNKAATGKK